MAKQKNISDAEWKIMKVLWKEPLLTLRQIDERVRDVGWSYTTVRTLVTRLLEKGAAAADKNGASFRYYPLLSESECRNSEMKSFLDKVFDGSRSRLVLSLTKDSRLTDAETQELMALIEKMDSDPDPDPEKE